MAPISRVRSRAGRHLVVLALLSLTALAVVLVPTGTAKLQVAPTNTAQPAITGTAAAGGTLTASQGTWSGSPTTFVYQWVRCPASGGAADGSDCAVIGGATTSSYIVATADVGFRLRVRVTASNADGANTAASNATELVTAQAGPPNTAPPTITGTPVVGSTLTAAPGTWTGTGITFAYAWQRCDAAGANCSPISGATTTSYVAATADVGRTLRVAVTATNASGSNTVTSAATAAVTAEPAPSPTGCPTDKSTRPISVDQVSVPAHLEIDRQQISPSPVVRSTQTVVIRIHISACGGRSIGGALVYVTPTPYQQFSALEQPTAADGWATLSLRRLKFFPATQQQQNLIVFVRARKNGEDLLAGISARRLISFRVNLK